MAKKAAPMGASLLQTKGTAKPVAGVPQRTPGSTRPVKERVVTEQINLKFEVEWVSEFREYAFRTGRKHTAVIKAAFEALKEKEALK